MCRFESRTVFQTSLAQFKRLELIFNMYQRVEPNMFYAMFSNIDFNTFLESDVVKHRQYLGIEMVGTVFYFAFDGFSSEVFDGFFLQRRIRKFVKHNSNRMKTMFKMVSGYGKIADGMMGAMSSFDKKLKKSMSGGGNKKKDGVVAGYVIASFIANIIPTNSFIVKVTL